MTQTVFITGADRGLGFTLASQLLEQNWRVIAGQYLPEWPELAALAQRFLDNLLIVPLDVGSEESVQAAAQASAAWTDSIDMLISNAGINSGNTTNSIRDPQNYAEMIQQYNINALGAVRVVSALLPLTDQGTLKRLCFVSSEAGSIGRAKRTFWYGYCTSKAALNMAAQIMFNDLHPQGYTFRLYHPGWMQSYIRGYKNTDATLSLEDAATAALAYFLPASENEDRLVLRDWEGQEWPW